MKGMVLLGAVLLVAGLLAFTIPIPRRENHSLEIGDAKVGLQTQTSEKLPPVVGGILLTGGVVALILGARRK